MRPDTLNAVGVIAGHLYQMARWHQRVSPEDITPVGGQVSMFIGPCLYCGKGYVPHLPHPCPSCGAELRKVAVWPLWVRGPRTFRVWRRWMVFKRAMWESLPWPVQVLWNTTTMLARLQAERT